MPYRFLRFPEGKTKAVTFSYDDGVDHDIRLAKTCNHYGIKCTFNINTARIAQKSGSGRLTADEIRQYILDAGHEVAIHGHEHKAPGLCSPIEIVQDVFNCRVGLENMFSQIIRGMAYPDSGISNLTVTDQARIEQVLIDLGVVYARTLGGDNDLFELPTDWYAWMPTAHHANPEVLRYAEKFVNLDIDRGYVSTWGPKLFYLWGHSFEFAQNSNWDLLEHLCNTLGGKKDIWYATNIEIYDYVQAYRSLQFSADGKQVYNPSLQRIWFKYGNQVWQISSGETLHLKTIENV